MARVLARRARERARGVPLRGPEDVPRSPADLTTEWLNAVLCRSTPGARVSSLRAHGGSVGTTTRQAVEITYNDRGAAAGLPTRLFVKCTSTVAQRLMLGLGGFIHGEPGFYTQVRPGLEIEAPIGHFAAVDDRSWRSIVVIEDVAATRGASFCGPSTGFTRQRIEDCLAAMARWHGALWNSPLLREWRWLKTPAEQMRVIDALIAAADRTQAGVERARSVTPAAVRRVDLLAPLRRSMEAASRGAPTYLHGDLHVGNTYATRDGTIGIGDWQTGLKGSWAHDYACIVVTALEVDDRRAWEHELLDFYLEHLAAAGGDALEPAAAWEAYRQATLYPYFAWLYTLGRSRLQPTFQTDETCLAMIRRIAAAVDDLESLAAAGR